VDPKSKTGSSPPDSGGGDLRHVGPELRQQSGQIERDLAQVFFQLLEKRQEASGSRAPPERTALRLHLELSPPGTPPAGGQLYSQLEGAVDRIVTSASGFPLGHVYCYWCQSFTCDHSSPPDSRCVFGGYTATGQPTWPEFVSLLLEKRHPRVDAIFRDDPSPVAVMQRGEELSSAQLPVYGKRSGIFQVLGQLSLGYLSYPHGLHLTAGSNGQRIPLALTFQVVETGRSGGPTVLNILGKLPGGISAFQALEESSDSRFADALGAARRGLSELSLFRPSRRDRRGGGERRQRAMGILMHLARNLEKIFRQRQRRTQHAQDRHLNKQRPTSTALQDALHAAPQSIYRDVEEMTWVILGPKNRVHIFNDDALHVTSIVYPGETVRERTSRGRWKLPRSEEMAAFRQALVRRAEAE
jgi:hypothetical protein